MKLPQKVETFLDALKSIEPYMPRRGDPLLTRLVKGGNVLRTLYEDFFLEREDLDILGTLLDKYNAEEVTNSWFANAFYRTKLNKKFTEVSYPSSEGISIEELTHPDWGTLVFSHTPWGVTEDFYQSQGFDFPAMLETWWEMFEGRINMEEGYLSTIPDHTDPLLGKFANSLMDLTLDRHQAYVKDGLSRTYIFSGIQGSGKTTFALHWIKRLNSNRVLRISANDIVGETLTNFSLVLTGLRPEFLIIDDIDKAGYIEELLSTLLGVMSDLRKSIDFPITMILTVNDISRLGRAFVRPSRVDEVIDFPPPTQTVRKAVVSGYLDEFGVTLSSKNLTTLVKASDKLTGAYLRELALRCKYWKFSDVLKSASQMQELAYFEDEY